MEDKDLFAEVQERQNKLNKQLLEQITKYREALTYLLDKVSLEDIEEVRKMLGFNQQEETN